MSLNDSPLQQVIQIRSALVCFFSAGVLFAHAALQLSFSVPPILLCLLTWLLINWLSSWRIQRGWPVTEIELLIQISADSLLLGLLLYFLGGATNPFSALLLLPLILAATSLSWRAVLLVAMLVVTTYSLLLQFYHPLIDLQEKHQHSLIRLFDLHVTGMWLNFLFSALLIVLFVVRLRQGLIQREHQLREVREQQLRDHQLLALATLAAGTAHELGTPLTTLQVGLDEMLLDHPELKGELSLLQQQVQACRERLRAMSHQAEHSIPSIEPADEWLRAVLETWQLLRPMARYKLEQMAGPSPSLKSDTTLCQAILNLLNNAADASPDTPLSLSLSWTMHSITLQISDHGPGLSPEQHARLGQPFTTTRDGLGLGLFLTTSILDRYDGEVRLFNQREGGTLTEVTLPCLHPEPDRG